MQINSDSTGTSQRHTLVKETVHFYLSFVNDEKTVVAESVHVSKMSTLMPCDGENKQFNREEKLLDSVAPGEKKQQLETACTSRNSRPFLD